MHTDNRCVDHLHRCIMGSGQCVHDPAPDASPPPAKEAVVVSGVRTEVIGQVAPRCPDRKTQKMPLRTRRSFTRGTPRGLFGSIGLMAVHSWSVVTHDPSPRFWGLESRPRAGPQPTFARSRHSPKCHTRKRKTACKAVSPKPNRCLDQAAVRLAFSTSMWPAIASSTATLACSIDAMA